MMIVMFILNNKLINNIAIFLLNILILKYKLLPLHFGLMYLLCFEISPLLADGGFVVSELGSL